jgi:glycosyltransferase involved in cell wall biosynthesis
MSPSLECAVAPMPAATHLFTPPGPAAPARSGLLFVGRLNAQKGLEHLLRAMARRRSDDPLTVVGDGPDAASLRALASQLGLASNVTWLPPVRQSELATLYRAARVLVVPSTEEGLGLVAVEAMLCETPVVAFASGGLPDVVDHGHTGWLAPPGDVDALAHALDTAASHDLGAVGRAGRAAAIAEFAPEVVSARYRAVYASVGGGRRRTGATGSGAA